MKNLWDNFYNDAQKWGIKRSSTLEGWKTAICGRKYQDKRPVYMLRLLALAWYEASDQDKQGEPLTCQSGETASQALGFGYFFAQHREKLIQEFRNYKDLGFSLLQANGDCQYLRTIHRYSGVVYLKTAEVARKLAPSKWITGKTLHPKIEEKAKLFVENAVDELLADVRDFWIRMLGRYRWHNAAPSLAWCTTEEPDIPKSVLKKILDTLWPDANNCGPEVHDSVPLFLLDKDGYPAIGLPDKPRFFADENVFRLCFVFRDRGGKFLKSIRFDRGNDGWMAETPDACVRLDNVGSVTRRELQGDLTSYTCIAEEDVTPEALREAEHLLFIQQNAGLRALDTQSSLGIGTRYYAVSPTGEIMSIRSIDENGKDTTIDQDCHGGFTVPNDASIIRIGETEYEVHTCINDWIDPEKRFRNVKNPGIRLFLTSGAHPFSDEFLEKENIGVRYRTSRGECIELQSLARGIVPPEVLWDRGILEFFNPDTGKLVDPRAKKPTTFFPEIQDQSLLEETFPLQDSGARTVWIGDEAIQVPIPDRKDHVEFDCNGFTFRYPLQRLGITLKLPNRENLLALGDDANPSLEVAQEDFDATSFSFVVAAGERQTSELQIDAGSADLPILSVSPPPKKLNGSKIKRSADQQWVEDDAIRRINLFQGHEKTKAVSGCVKLYDPVSTKVEWERKGNDLACQFFLAWKRRQCPLALFCFPRHRPDASPKTIEASEVTFEDLPSHALRVSLLFKDLFRNSNLDWGPGLHAFVVCRTANAVDAITPMFAIKRPRELGPWNGVCQHCDPHGLRRAIALADLPEIDRIMQSSDKACRNYVREFERNTYDAWNAIGRVSQCPAYQEGYFFVADWWVREVAMAHPQKTERTNKRLVEDLGEDYKDKGIWSPLLVRRQDDEGFARDMRILASIQQRTESVKWVTTYTFQLVATEMTEGLQRELGNMQRKMTELMVGIMRATRKQFPDTVADDLTALNAQGMPLLPDTMYTQSDLEDCLARLGNGVASWLRHPTCETAKPLRDLLLRVEKLDHMFRDLNPDETRYTMLERIAMKAWVFANRPQTDKRAQ